MNPLEELRIIRPLTLFIILSFAFRSTCLAEENPQQNNVGYLKYKNGDVVKGRLISYSEAEGVFLSERFGEIKFTSEEGIFISDDLVPESEIDKTKSINVANLEKQSANRQPNTWHPESWSVGGGLELSEGTDTKEFDVEIEARAKWTFLKNEVNVNGNFELELEDSVRETDSRDLTINWTYDLNRNWFTQMNFDTERDQSDAFEREYDYLLIQLSGGLGYRFFWTKDFKSRISLMQNRARLRLFDFNQSFYLSGQTINLHNHLKVTESTSIEQWVTLYFWENNQFGFDGETDLKHTLNKQLSLVLRHQYREKPFTLDEYFRNEIKLLVKYKF